MTITVKSLSHSTISTYTAGCPEKVFLDKIDHRKKRSYSANAIMGICFHAVCETFYRGLLLGHTFGYNILYRVFSETWNHISRSKKRMNRKVINFIIAVSIAALQNFVTVTKKG